MAQDREMKGIWADIFAEKRCPELMRHRYARALVNPNSVSIDMYFKYDDYDDDYIRCIEKHGKLTGQRF